MGHRPHYGHRLIVAASIIETLPMGNVLPTTRGPGPSARCAARRPSVPTPGLRRSSAPTASNPPADEVAEVVERRRKPQPVPKPAPKFNGGRNRDTPPHPAPFSDAVLDAFRELLDEHHDGRRRYRRHGRQPTVLDPFAGTGRIHELRPGWWTHRRRARAGVGRASRRHDLRRQPTPAVRPGQLVDAIATSPAYGNRLADSYDASDPEARRSYAIDLGRPLTEGNGAGMQWGAEYRRAARAGVGRVRADDCDPAACCCSTARTTSATASIVAVTGWHVRTLVELGLAVIDLRTLRSAGLPFTTAEPLSELVVAFRKETT